MQYFKNLKIATKFILSFLLISLVPLAIAIYISYNVSRKVLKEEIMRSLSAVADNKANQIEAYLLKKKQDGLTLSYMPEITDALKKCISAFHNAGIDFPAYKAVEQEIKPMLVYYQKLFGYEDILFIEPDGNVVFSAQGKKDIKSLYETVLYSRSELADVFIKAISSKEDMEISNFEYYPQTKNAAVFIATPIFEASSLLIGVIVFQVDNQGIYEFVKDYTGLGKTGETIIASRIKDEAVFITPVRFDSEATFKRKIKINPKEGSDIQKALLGENVSGVSVDYRNQKALAVWRYLPTFQLGMVVKMDIAEVYASANKLKNNLLGISLVLLAVVALMAVIMSRSFSNPITELTSISKIISAGKLSARAKIEAQDEIGELAQSFNQMTDSLVEAKTNVEQKKAELEEQKKLLEMANKELDSFVYTVSHDLRAPLRGIDGFADFLEQDCSDKLDNQGKDYLSRIRSGVKRMQTLIDDLLKLSRISRIKNPYENVDMNELIRSVTARLEFDIKQHNVELKIAEGLPVVNCDRIKVEEVYFNLVNNAIKFSSKNKDDRPKVEIGYNDKNDAHEFWVKDNGIGIDKKYHKDIFGIFQRLHRQEEYEGTGTGLAIVKKIIDDHQGSIWVDSEPGKGAMFCFTIPKQLKEKKKLGQILVEEGVATEEQIRKSLEKQEKGEV